MCQKNKQKKINSINTYAYIGVYILDFNIHLI